MNGQEKPSIRDILDEIAAEFCDKYCKWPYLWDDEKEGMDLCESEHCENCPMTRLC